LGDQIDSLADGVHSHPAAFRLAARAKGIERLALVTDAVTPGVSDPGSYLVAAVRQELGETVKIESVPGPSALTAALSLAGTGFDRFLFLGFLPHKKGRQTMLKEIFTSEYPAVVYESKHRIIKLLEELTKMGAEKRIKINVSVARELTKLHESFYVGEPDAVGEKLQADVNNLKGEFVVLIKKI